MSYIHGSHNGMKTQMKKKTHSDTVQKKGYQMLATCPILDYSDSLEILQFAYDLSMWSTLGGQKSLNKAPMRIVTGGASFTPLSWQRVSYALTYLVRQLGPPKFMWTILPHDWSFPYHVCVTDEMSKMLRRRLHLPVKETLHVAHTLCCNSQRVWYWVAMEAILTGGDLIC